MTLRSFLSSVALVMVGVAAGYPAVAWSKGQLCNAPPEEGRKVELTLTAASIDGAPATSIANVPGLQLKTEFLRDSIVHAVVANPSGGTRVVHVERSP